MFSSSPNCYLRGCLRNKLHIITYFFFFFFFFRHTRPDITVMVIIHSLIFFI